jgi:4-hydroxy-tetrahydrodipicolinate synthase
MLIIRGICLNWILTICESKILVSRMRKLVGSITPVVTPFRNGSLDELALSQLIDWQIAQGAHGISVTGTTGEPSSLSRDERLRVVELAARTVADRVPFIPGIGTNNLEDTLFFAQHAQKAGATALLVITPYYNRPSQDGLFQYFRQIASQVDVPVILYNIPGRTAVNLEIDTVARLHEACPNIVGVKEANKDFEHINLLCHRMGHEFLVYSGIELLCFPLLAIGGAGYISATANLMPKKVAELYNLTMAGRWLEARALHYDLMPLNEAIFFEINPVPVKTALGWMGKISPEVRLPLAPMTSENQTRLRKVLQTYQLISM